MQTSAVVKAVREIKRVIDGAALSSTKSTIHICHCVSEHSQTATVTKVVIGRTKAHRIIDVLDVRRDAASLLVACIQKISCI